MHNKRKRIKKSKSMRQDVGRGNPERLKLEDMIEVEGVIYPSGCDAKTLYQSAVINLS